MACNHAPSGCNYPEGDCNGCCLIANVERRIRAKRNKEHEMTDQKQPEPEVLTAGKHGEMQFITLQSHREAMARLQAENSLLHERHKNDCKVLDKKDAALKAQNKALIEWALVAETVRKFEDAEPIQGNIDGLAYWKRIERKAEGEARAAITQAQEALK